MPTISKLRRRLRFHFSNKYPTRILILLFVCVAVPNAKYLCNTLDICHIKHIQKTGENIKLENIIQQLSGSGLGADANTIRKSSLSTFFLLICKI